MSEHSWIPSTEVFQEKIALFDLEPVDTSVENLNYIEIQPTSLVNQGGCIDFSYTSPYYVDLKHSSVILKVRLMNGTEEIPKIDNFKAIPKAAVADPPTPAVLAPAANGNVSVVNNLFHSLFSTASLSLQDQNTNAHMTSQGYSYKAYLDVVREKPNKKHLSQLYIKDDVDGTDSCNAYLHTAIAADEHYNTALGERAKYLTGSNHHIMESALNLDICQQDRLIPHNVPINIKLYQSNPNFYIISPHTNKSYRIEILDARLKLATYKLSPTCIIALEETLKEKPAQYPMKKSVVKSYVVPRGSHSCIFDNMFPEGIIPDSLLIGMVSSEDYNGAVNSSPFDFDNFGCNYLGYFINDLPLPTRPMHMHFGDTHHSSNIVEPWLNLHKRNPDCDITLEEFHLGFTLFQIDINQPSVDGISPLTQKGSSKLELKFEAALKESINVIIYAQFRGLVTIDHSRNVTVV